MSKVVHAGGVEAEAEADGLEVREFARESTCDVREFVVAVEGRRFGVVVVAADADVDPLRPLGGGGTVCFFDILALEAQCKK